MLRVNAETVAKDPVAEVHWPAGYSPKKADCFVHKEALIRASPETVWHYLIAVTQWPSWFPNAYNIRILTSQAALAPGAKFSWNFMGSSHVSTVAEYVPNQRLT